MAFYPTYPHSYYPPQAIAPVLAPVVTPMAAVFFGVGYYPAEYGGVPPPAHNAAYVCTRTCHGNHGHHGHYGHYSHHGHYMYGHHQLYLPADTWWSNERRPDPADQWYTVDRHGMYRPVRRFRDLLVRKLW